MRLRYLAEGSKYLRASIGSICGKAEAGPWYCYKDDRTGLDGSMHGGAFVIELCYVQCSRQPWL